MTDGQWPIADAPWGRPTTMDPRWAYVNRSLSSSFGIFVFVFHFRPPFSLALVIESASNPPPSGLGNERGTVPGRQGSRAGTCAMRNSLARALAFWAALVGVIGGSPAVGDDPDDRGAQFFETEVRPLL